MSQAEAQTQVCRGAKWGGVFRQIGPDALYVLAIMAIGVAIALTYFHYSGRKPSFYQERMPAAVMWASGKGLVYVSPKQVPGLDDFLQLKTDTFSPSNIPVDVRVGEAGTWAHTHLYQFAVISAWWRCFGISWTGLYPLYAIFYGISLVFCYAILRLGLQRPLAMLGAFLFAVSPLHLGCLPLFRDYSKAPFMLASIFVLGLLIKSPPKAWRISLYALAGGIIAGLGLGFRQDLLVIIPAFFVIVLFFMEGRPWQHLLLKALAIGLYMGGFALVGLPMLITPGESSNIPAWFLQGLTETFSIDLGTGGVFYSWGQHYKDMAVDCMIHTQAVLKHGDAAIYAHGSEGYARYGAELLTSIFWTFPADILVRTYAAVLAIVDQIPFYRGIVAPEGITQAALVRFYEYRHMVLSFFWMRGHYFVILALVLISTRNLRMAFACLFMILYFAGHTCMQFGLRHFFYLGFIAWFGIFFVFQECFRYGWRHHGESILKKIQVFFRSPEGVWKPPVKRVAVFAGISVIGLVSPLAALRQYQPPEVRKVVEAYRTAELEKVDYTVRSVGGGKIRIEPVVSFDEQMRNPAEGAPMVQPSMWVVVINTAVQSPVTLSFRYAAAYKENTLDDVLTVEAPPRSAPNKRTFTVYCPIMNVTAKHWEGFRAFQCLEVAESEAPAIKGIFRVKDPAQLPFMMQMILPPDWASWPLYQRLLHYRFG